MLCFNYFDKDTCGHWMENFAGVKTVFLCQNFALYSVAIMCTLYYVLGYTYNVYIL